MFKFSDVKTKLVAGVAALTVAGSASAQAVDISSVTSAITSAAVAGAAIGLAVLGLHYGMKLYKWVKQAG